MDISRIQSAAASTITHNRADESADIRSSSRPSKSNGTAAATDAVQVHSGTSESSELTAARAAMKQIDTIDEARRLEIQERIQSGFYNSPEAIEKVAGAMAEALTPKQTK